MLHTAKHFKEVHTYVKVLYEAVKNFRGKGQDEPIGHKIGKLLKSGGIQLVLPEIAHYSQTRASLKKSKDTFGPKFRAERTTNVE